MLLLLCYATVLTPCHYICCYYAAAAAIRQLPLLKKMAITMPIRRRLFHFDIAITPTPDIAAAFSPLAMPIFAIFIFDYFITLRYAYALLIDAATLD